jgi:hypothetical protein
MNLSSSNKTKEKHKANSLSNIAFSALTQTGTANKRSLFDKMTQIDYKDMHFLLMGTPVNSDINEYIEVINIAI